MVCASGRYASSGLSKVISSVLARELKKQWSLFTNFTTPSSRRW